MTEGLEIGGMLPIAIPVPFDNYHFIEPAVRYLHPDAP